MNKVHSKRSGANQYYNHSIKHSPVTLSACEKESKVVLSLVTLTVGWTTFNSDGLVGTTMSDSDGTTRSECSVRVNAVTMAVGVVTTSKRPLLVERGAATTTVGVVCTTSNCPLLVEGGGGTAIEILSSQVDS